MVLKIHSSKKVSFEKFIDYAFIGSLNEQMMKGCIVQIKEDFIKENQEFLREKYERYYYGKGKGKGLDTRYWGIRLDWTTPAEEPMEPIETEDVKDTAEDEELKDYVRVQQALGGHTYN